MTTVASPVRAPPPIPEALSMYTVFDDVEVGIGGVRVLSERDVAHGRDARAMVDAGDVGAWEDPVAAVLEGQDGDAVAHDVSA